VQHSPTSSMQNLQVMQNVGARNRPFKSSMDVDFKVDLKLAADLMAVNEKIQANGVSPTKIKVKKKKKKKGQIVTDRRLEFTHRENALAWQNLGQHNKVHE